MVLRSRHCRTLLVVATAAALAAPSEALARSGHHGATDWVATFHDPGAPGFSNEHLDCTNSGAAACGFAFDGTTVETGYLSGSTTYHGILYAGDAVERTFRWKVTETFTGRIAGCGRGTVKWTGSGYGDATAFDLESQGARMWGSLTIAPGSGTRDLRDVTGSLALEARAHGVPPGAQDGTMTGPLTCHPGDD